MGDEDLAVKVAETDARSKSNKYRIDKLEERQDNLDRLTAGFVEMKTEQEYIKEDLGEIKVDVKKLAEIPSKRWESVVGYIITLVVGMAVSVLFKGF